MSRKLRVEFIKKNFPGYMSINAFMDLQAIREIKYALVDGGMYSVHAARVQVLDQSVVSMLIEAQGKKMIRNIRSDRGAKGDKY